MKPIQAPPNLRPSEEETFAASRIARETNKLCSLLLRRNEDGEQALQGAIWLLQQKAYEEGLCAADVAQWDRDVETVRAYHERWKKDAVQFVELHMRAVDWIAAWEEIDTRSDAEVDHLIAETILLRVADDPIRSLDPITLCVSVEDSVKIHAALDRVNAERRFDAEQRTKRRTNL